MEFWIFFVLFVVSALFLILSIFFEWGGEAIAIFTLCFFIFGLFGGFCFNQQYNQKKCKHSFIVCDHKQDEHTEYSLCKVFCADCDKEIGVFTPKEIFEYNLSHR